MYPFYGDFTVRIFCGYNNYGYYGGFGLSEENMRAKSSRSIRRITGLAMVFVLAMALLVSGITLSFGHNGENNVANASVTKKPTDVDEKNPLYLDIDDVFTWNSLIDLNLSSGNLATKNYSPSTYKNYYAYLGGVYTGISNLSLTDTSASMSPAAIGNVELKFYAYYRLPDFLVTSNATIAFSANFPDCISASNVKNLAYSISLCGEPGNEGTTYESPAAVTLEARYLKITVSCNENGSENLTISNLALAITINSLNKDKFDTSMISTKPVVEAWDGVNDSAASIKSGTISQLATAHTATPNLVGGVDWFTGEDKNELRTDGSSDISLTSLRTDGTFTKTFSFLLYDNVVGLKEATLGSLDLMAYYKANPSATGAHTYGRTDFAESKSLVGIQTVTVRPFDYGETAATSSIFRGMYVTVLFDGKDYLNKDSQYAQTYRANATNQLGNVSKNLVVSIGGLDYTDPEVPAINITSNYTTDKDAVIWVDASTLYLRANVNSDARGDVKYYFSLYKRGTDGLYSEVIVDAASYIEDYGHLFTPNIDFGGNDLLLSIPIPEGQTADGYYKLSIKAIDAAGQYYLNNSTTATYFSSHVKVGEATYFAVDTGTNGKTDADWINSATVTQNEQTINYDGSWTNQQILVKFNELSTISGVTYEYRYDGETKKLSMADFATFDNSALQYIIYEDVANAKDGFTRTYYFRATLGSGKVFNYSIDVKFDNWNGITPYSTTLTNYSTSAHPYSDLLELPIDLYVKDDGVTKRLSDYTMGSGRTLYYQIGSGAVKALTVTNDETALDIFGGINVTENKQISIKMWFVDEAGNKSADYTQNIYIDTAKVYVKLAINPTAKKYFSNTNVTPENLFTYQLFSDAEYKTLISSSMLRATFASYYENANAGENKIVYVNKLKLSQPAETSPYYYVYNKYVVCGVGTDNAVNVIVDDNTVFDAARHTIQKARLAVKQNTSLSRVYDGTTIFVVNGNDSDTFTCIDDVVGNDWADLVWGATISFSTKFVELSGSGHVTSKSAELLKNTITITRKGNGADVSGNYQLVGYTGSQASIPCYAKITPAYITLKTLSTLTKVYDGTKNANIGSADYVLEGIIAGDDIYLKKSILEEAVYPSANVGSDYTVVINTELYGNDIRNYILVDNLTDKNQLNTASFTGASITKKTVSVKFGTVKKVFDNNKKITLTKGSSSNENEYNFVGILDSDAANVTLKYTGEYPSADFKGTTYDVNLTLTLEGENAANYSLEPNVTLKCSIVQRGVKAVKVLGIYVVDSNGNYLYRDNDGNIYQKSGDGYVKYAVNGTSANVTENDMLAAEGSVKWMAKKFVKGGAIITNGHRFDLNTDVKYAVEYYSDDAMTNLIDIADNTLTKNKINLFSDFTFKGNSGSYAVTVGVFASDSNFKLQSNPVKTGISVEIVDFDDVVFDGKVYSAGGVAAIDGYVVVFDGNLKSVKFVYDESRGAISNVSLTYDADPLHAGTYTATLRLTRDSFDYIMYQKIEISKKATSLEMSSSDTLTKDYGTTFEDAEKISDANKTLLQGYEKLGGTGNIVNYIVNNIYYQYSTSSGFKSYTLDAPYLKGAGYYYVRAVFEGNADFEGSVSEPRAIYINPVNFSASNINYSVGDSVSEVEVSAIIEEKFKENTDVINCFVVVYLQGVPQYGSIGAAAYITAVPSAVGTYKYKIVHKDSVDYETGSDFGILKADFTDINILSVAKGDFNGTLIISEKHILSSGSNGLENGNGALDTTFSTPVFPSIAEQDGTLKFYAINQTAGNWSTNFNNGLHEQAETIGNYKVSTLYQTSLAIRFKDGKEELTSDFNTVKVTLKATVADGTKVFRFDFNSDNTYTVSEMQYVNNGDGTVSFESDKLGWFAVADTYTPSVAKNNNGVAIGAGIGGGVAGIIGIALVIVFIKKKRLI